MNPLPRWLPAARRGLVAACLLLGLATAALTGGGGPALAAVTAVAFLVGRLRRGTTGPSGLARWRAGNFVALAACVLAAVGGVGLLRVAMGLVAWLQVHRAWTGRRAADDRVALLLTLLMVLLSCILTSSSALGPLFVALALLGPAALLLAWLEGELGEGAGAAAGDRGGLGGLLGLPVAAVALTAAFFLFLPRVQRVGLGADGPGATLAGFDDDVEIGDLGAILDNPQAVLTARVTDGTGARVSGPFYLRGVSLSEFDGRGWKETLGGAARVRRVRLPDVPPERVLRQEITLEPVSHGVLFVVAPVWSVDGAGGELTLDTAGTWRTRRVGRTVQYTALSILEPPGAPPLDLPDAPAYEGHRINERAALRTDLWTDLPPGIDPEVLRLADQLGRQAGEGASEWERALLVRDYLRGNLRYTMVPEPGSTGQPLSAFLFESKAGHCEYFATALAVLLRAQGTPARLVNGFYGGEDNPLGDFVVVRQRDAHSWVEAWLDDGSGQRRWVLLDATPAADGREASGPLRQLGDWLQHAWHNQVLQYDLDQQVALGLEGVAVAQRVLRPPAAAPAAIPGWAPGVGVGLLGIGALVGLLRGVRFLAGGRRRAPPSGPVARRWRSALRLVARRGWRVPAALPPVEAARWLRVRAGDAAEPLERLAWLHYRVRYGGEPDRALVDAARAARRDLDALPRRRRA